ncbi:Sensor histidine kinase YehU [Paenibacillus konkukensis]|uniref:histidine kinase n=2 Tax=Paenibacillus konkukensis TaxID=2020716 RepID=A0ABY4RX58_9BACL|nr:Sensor histidine kinase YehU [Paenibacillus konkukensis]
MRIVTGMSLKQKLLLMVGISTLMIFLLQIYYYMNFYGLTEDKENIHTSNIMKQVEERLVSFNQDIKDAALASAYNTMTHDYLGSGDPIYRLKLNKMVMEILSGVKAANKNIQSILMVDKSGNIIGASNPDDYVVLDGVKKKYSLNIQNPKAQFYGKITAPELANPAYVYIQPIFSSINDASDTPELGTCVVIYKTDALDHIVRDIKGTPNSRLLIVDNEQRIVTASEAAAKGKFFDVESLDELSKADHLQIKEIGSLQWKIVSLIPIKEMTDELRAIRNIGLIIGMVMTLIILLMGLLFIRSVTIPLSAIIRFVNYIGNYGGKQRLLLSVRSEIGILATEINRMLDKIDEANEKFIQANTSLYQMELAKKQAELSSLQSQINPHFLYNTLECIRSIALASKVMEIVEISIAMAQIFRYGIKEENFVLIRSEIGCIQDYLRIMSIRYVDKFHADIRIEESLLDLKMPKMILQPIVENAVYHGLERKSGKGGISIKGWKTKDGWVCFEIADDGKGIGEEELRDLQHYLSRSETHQQVLGERGMGLLNIHKRIRLAFGEQYGIEIESRIDAGTRVTLQLPALDRKDDEGDELPKPEPNRPKRAPSI